MTDIDGDSKDDHVSDRNEDKIDGSKDSRDNRRREYDEPLNNSLLVRNLPFTIRSDDIRDLFC